MSPIMPYKIISSVDYNYWLKRVDTQSNEPINQNSIKVSKDVKPTNIKTLLLNFGDYCNILQVLKVGWIEIFHLEFFAGILVSEM